MSKKEAAKQFVEMKIHGKKVVVFSKTYCPYCSMAKKALKPHVGKEIKPDQYEVIEIENRPDCSEIQACLRQLTGASSVPRVFINGQCIGGGDETSALESSGQLSVFLRS